MKHTEPKSEFFIRGKVHWRVGSSWKEGRIVNIYKSDKVSGLSVRSNRENDRAFVIKRGDSRIIMKLERDVALD